MGNLKLADKDWQEMTTPNIIEASYLNVFSTFSLKRIKAHKAGNILGNVHLTDDFNMLSAVELKPVSFTDHITIQINFCSETLQDV